SLTKVPQRQFLNLTEKRLPCENLDVLAPGEVRALCAIGEKILPVRATNVSQATKNRNVKFRSRRKSRIPCGTRGNDVNDLLRTISDYIKCLVRIARPIRVDGFRFVDLSPGPHRTKNLSEMVFRCHCFTQARRTD